MTKINELHLADPSIPPVYLAHCVVRLADAASAADDALGEAQVHGGGKKQVVYSSKKGVKVYYCKPHSTRVFPVLAVSGDADPTASRAVAHMEHGGHSFHVFSARQGWMSGTARFPIRPLSSCTGTHQALGALLHRRGKHWVPFGGGTTSPTPRANKRNV